MEEEGRGLRASSCELRATSFELRSGRLLATRGSQPNGRGARSSTTYHS